MQVRPRTKKRFALTLIMSVAAFVLLSGQFCPFGGSQQAQAPAPAAAPAPVAAAPAADSANAADNQAPAQIDTSNLEVQTLTLTDANGNPRAILNTDNSGAPAFALLDANGNPRTRISLDGNGNPFVDLYNSKGDILSSYWVENDAPYLTYRDKNGQTVTIIPKDQVAPARPVVTTTRPVTRPVVQRNPPPATSSNDNMTVYVVNGVYHLRTCSKIVNKTKRPMVLSDAIANGFIPDPKCLGGQAPSASRTSQGGPVTAQPGRGGSAPAPGSGGQTVWVINGQPFYHNRGCPALVGKGGHQMALSDAKANSYGPHKKCNAPQ